MKLQYGMWMVWPAFLMAAVMEVVVFSLVDPSELHWLGHDLGWSRYGVYSIAFLFFWGVISLSSAITLWLSFAPDLAGEPQR